MSDPPSLPPVRLPLSSKPVVSPAKPVVVAAGDRRAMISLQEHLIDKAIAAGASDLHIEPRSDRLRLRIRVDGWLHELESLPRWMHASLVSRFKVLTGMDLTERRRPQDGRATHSGPDGSVDLRVATLDTQHGEKVVVRLLPRSRAPLELEALGLDGEGLRVVAGFVEQPHGLILAAGPTGAGKTTTLYALLRRVDAVGRHVVTLEDPIEYRLDGAVQVPIRRSIGVDFASALRAVLRQDPDVILVGEIRDEETARVAVRSAITGHLVLSSVHTNSAVESATRLLELGVPGYLVAGALIGVISQRLVRRLCPRCREPADPPRDVTERLSLPPANRSHRYFRPRGCAECRAGFAGRVGIFETFEVKQELRGYLARGQDCLQLESLARRSGALRTLHSAAVAALRHGSTSPQEVARILPYDRGAAAGA